MIYTVHLDNTIWGRIQTCTFEFDGTTWNVNDPGTGLTSVIAFSIGDAIRKYITDSRGEYVIDISMTDSQEYEATVASVQPPSIQRISTPRKHYLTLMPHSSYEKTARSLPTTELKLMLVVSLRVLRLLQSYPSCSELNSSQLRSVKLWSGRISSLQNYAHAMADELNVREHTYSLDIPNEPHATKPHWVFWPRLQQSHQAYINLRKIRGAFADDHAHLWKSCGMRAYLRAKEYGRLQSLSVRDMLTIDNCWQYPTDCVCAEENFVYPTPL